MKLTVPAKACNETIVKATMPIRESSRMMRWLSFVMIGVMMMGSGIGLGQATNTWSTSAAGATWVKNSNWTTTSFIPGNGPNTNVTIWGSNTDVAQIGLPASLTTLSINFNAAAANGVSANSGTGTPFNLGAIVFQSTATQNLIISNSASSTAGVMNLNGGYNLSNVIIDNQNTTRSLTLQNGTSAMEIALNNATNNIIKTAAGGIAISSIVSGGNPLEKQGAGILNLSGGNTYTGLTTVTAGTLQLSRSGGTTIPNANNVTVSGGTFKVSTNQTIANFTMTSGALQVDAGVTLTITGTYSVSGGTINNLGTLKLNGATASFPGTAVTVNNGTASTMTNLHINTSGAVTLTAGFTVAGTLTLASGSLDVNGSTLTLNNSLSSAQSVTGAGTNSFTISSTAANGIVSLAGTTPHSVTLSGFGTTASGGLVIGSNTALQMNSNAALNCAGNGTTTSMLTIAGKLQMNSVTSSNIVAGTTPFYTSASTLEYRVSYGPFQEWLAGSALTTPGVPQNVLINGSGIIVTMPNGNRNCAGDVSIAQGTLTLNATAGDLTLGGNWSRATTATFNANGKAVVFNGTGTQTIAVTPAGGTENFAYFIVNKTAGSVQLVNTTTPTNVTLTASAGDVLQLNNTGGLDVNGQVFTMSGAGGNIALNSGARSISSTAFNGSFDITVGQKAVTGGGTLSFGSNVLIHLPVALDFGNNVTTVNGTLVLQGGFANNFGPKYGAGSTLFYLGGNTLAAPFVTSLEWPTTNGPTNISIGAATNVALNSNYSVVGNVIIFGGGLRSNSGLKTITMSGGTVATPKIFQSNAAMYGEYGGNSLGLIFNGVTQVTGTTGYLDAKTYTVNGTIICDNTGLNSNSSSPSPGQVIIAPGGTLKTSNPNGLYDGATLNPTIRFSGSNMAAPSIDPGSFIYYNEGSGGQTVSALNYGYLIFLNFLGTNTLAGNVSAVEVDLGPGKLDAGTNTLSVTSSSTSAVSTTSGYLIGKLKRAIASGTSTNIYNFPVGDASSSTPLSINFASVGTAGDVTVNTNASPGAPVAASGLSSTKYLNRSWTATSTVGTPNYAATFNFVPGDLVSTTAANLGIAKLSGGVWSSIIKASSTTTSVTTVTGLTSFSDFVLGECGTPVVSGISNTTVPRFGGLVLTITGSNFSVSGNTVTMGGIPVTIQTENTGSIKVFTPSDACSGNVVVTNACSVASNGFAYTVSAPVISSLSTTTLTPGNNITISGTGGSFGNTGNTVTIGGITASIVTQSGNSIVATVPAGIPCSGVVVVTNCNGPSNGSPYTSALTPVISGISNTNIPRSGGLIVIITGSDFSASGNTVTMGGITVLIEVENTGSIRVISPSNACSGNVVVTNACSVPSNGFAYTVSAPVISSLSTTTLTPGNNITISGTGASFGNTGNAVTIGGITASIVTQSGNSIVATIPAGIPCSGLVVVTNCNGPSNGKSFNNTPAVPTITPAGPINSCTGPATLTSSAASGNQWYKGGVTISGETGTTYLATAAGSYTVTASNNGCESAQSTAVTVTLNEPVIISQQPQSLTTVCIHTAVSLSVTATGTAPVTYQWYTDNDAVNYNGGPISGATSDTYTVPDVSGLYFYYCVLTNTCGSVNSNYATTDIKAEPDQATVGANQTRCGLTSAGLGGNNPTNGAGQWTQVSGPVGGTTTFVNEFAAGSAATASVLGIYVYQWTIYNNPCTASSAQITVTYNASITWYQDNDLDGYGNSSVSQDACTQPVGYVATGDDCDDSNPGVNPGVAGVSVWTGMSSSSWTDPANWCGGVPGPASKAIVKAIAVASPASAAVISADVSIKDLVIEDGAVLTCTGGHTLTLSGDMTIDNGGTFTQPTGIIRFESTGITQHLSCDNAELTLPDVQVACYQLVIHRQSSSASLSVTCGDLSITAGSSCQLSCTSGYCRTLSVASTGTCDLSALSSFTCAESFSMLGSFRAPELMQFTCESGTCTIEGDMTALNKIRKIDASHNSALPPAQISFTGSWETGDLSLDNTELTAICGTATTCPFTFTCADLRISSSAAFKGGKLPKLTSIGTLATALGRYQAPTLTEFTNACTVSGFSGLSGFRDMTVRCPLASTVILSGDISMDAFTLAQGRCVSECSSGTGTCASVTCSSFSTLASTMCDLSSLSLLSCAGSFSMLGQFRAPELMQFTCTSGTCAIDGDMVALNKIRKIDFSHSGPVPAEISFSGSLETGALSLVNTELTAECGDAATCLTRTLTCGDISIDATSTFNGGKLPKLTSVGALATALGRFMAPALTEFTCPSGTCTVSGLSGQNSLRDVVVDCPVTSKISVAGDVAMIDIIVVRGELSAEPCTGTCPLFTARDMSVSAEGKLDMSRIRKIESSGSFHINGVFVSPPLTSFTCASGACTVSGATGSNKFNDVEIDCASNAVVSLLSDIDMGDLSVLNGKLSAPTCTASCKVIVCDDLSIAAPGQLDASSLAQVTCDGSYSNLGHFTCPPTTKFTCSSGACTLSGDMMATNAFSELVFEGADGSLISSAAPITATQVKVKKDRTTIAPRLVAAALLGSRISVSPGASLDLSGAVLEFADATTDKPCELDDQSSAIHPSSYGSILVGLHRPLSLGTSKIYLAGDMECNSSVSGQACELTCTSGIAATLSGSSMDVSFGKLSIAKPASAVSISLPRLSVADLAISTGVLHCGSSEVYVQHSLTNDCSVTCLDAQSSRFIFGGTTSLVGSGGSSSTRLHHITCNTPGGVALSNDLSFTGELSLLDGIISTGASTLTCESGCTVSDGGPTTFVYGKFKAGTELSTSVNKKFPLGTIDGTIKRYSPVSVTLHDVSGAGALTFSATEASHPEFLTSGLSSTKRVSTRFTAVPDLSLSFSTCDVTMQYDASASSGSPSLYRVAKFDAPSTWSSPTVLSRTASSITVVVDSYSDFLIGETDCNDPGEWTGLVSSDWNDPSNWCSNTVPTQTTAVIIRHVNHPPVIDSDVSAASVVIDTDASLTVSSSGRLVLFGGSSGAGSALSVSGELHLQPSGGEIVVHGDMSVPPTGSVFSGGKLSVDGDLSVLGAYSGTTGTFEFSGSAVPPAPRIQWTWVGGDDAVTRDYGHVIFSRQARTGRNPQTGRCASLSIVSGELAFDGLSSEMQVDGDVSVSSGSKLICGSSHLYVTGGWSMDGDMDEGTSVVEFKGGGSKELTGTVSLLKFYDLVVAKTGGVVTGNINVGNASMQVHTMTLHSGALEAGTFTDIAVSGDWKVDAGAIFTYGACSVSFTGTGPQTIGGGTSLATALGKAINTKPLTGTANRLFVTTPELSLEDLVLTSGEMQLGSARVVCTGSLVHTGGELFAETSKFVFTGSGTHTVSGLATTFHDIDVDGDAILTVDPVTELSVTGDMSVYGAKQGSSGRTKFTGDDEQFFSYNPVAGAPASTFGDLSFENTSPQGVTITGDGTHPIVARTGEYVGYVKLLTVMEVGKAIVKAIAVVSPSSAAELIVRGDMTVSGQYDGQAGKLTFSGSGDQVFDYSPDVSALSSNFGAISISNTGGTSGATVQVLGSGGSLTAASLAVTAGTAVLHIKVISQDDLTVGTYGVLSIPGATELSVAGDWINDGVFNAGASTVRFNGIGTSHIGGSAVTETFNDIISSCLNLHDDRAFLGLRNLIIPAGTLKAGPVMQFSGSLSLEGSGSFDPNGGTCKFHNNGLNQVVLGAVDFHNLELDNTAGLSLTGGDVDLDGTLTLTNGHIRLSDHDLALSVVAVISGASRDRYVETPALGSLRMYVPHQIIPAFFPIGSASSYSPVSLSLSGSSGTGGATLGSRVADAQPSVSYTGDVPDIAAAKVPRTILKTYFETGDIPTGDQLTMSVQWNESDEPPTGFDRALCNLAHYTAGAWSYGEGSAATVVSVSPPVYSQTRTGITDLSPFAVFGQGITCSVPATSFCAGANVTVTYNTFGGTWNLGNTFTAQLSDAGGSFASAVNIGSAGSTVSGTITATIPALTAVGSGYRIRVVSDDPAGDGDDNGTDLTVTSCAVTVHAEPGVSNPTMTTLLNVPANTSTLSFGQVYKLIVPLFNDNADNALPAGSTTVTIDLGSKMAVDVSFNMLTAPLSQYFHWSHTVVSGHDIITGDQYADIPPDWFGSAIFNVGSTGSCRATLRARFIVDNHATSTTLVDENINNNTAAIFYNSPVTLTATPVPATCFGTVTGNINVVSSPGTTVVITNAASQVVTAPFAAGTYTVTATADSELPLTTVCSEMRTVTVTEPAAITVSNVAQSTIACHGGTATVTITASGGTAPLSYTFNGITNANGIFTLQTAGTYAYSVTDANSCAAAAGNFTVAEPALITVSNIAQSTIACHGGTATVTITAGGGTAPLSYTFNGITNANGIFTLQTAGTYAYSVTDANSCAAAAGNFTVAEPALITVSNIAQSTIACHGGTATVTITAGGGTAPFSYTFNGITNANGIFTLQIAGTYAYSVTDANSCAAAAGNFTVTEPATLSAGSSATTIECHGGTSTVTIVATGGTAPYSYSFNSQTNTNGIFTGVLAGTNLAYTVTDAHSCSFGGTITITEPTGTVPDISLGSDYEANFFGTASIGSEYRIVYNITEIEGNPAVGDTLRIIKAAGYTISMDNLAFTSTIGSSTYTLDNGNWKIDDSNPSFVSIILMDATHTNGIPGTLSCGRKVYVEVKFKRNTPNASTFSLSARLRKTSGELNQGNNLNSIVFTSE